jgi:hypothetical protein
MVPHSNDGLILFMNPVLRELGTRCGLHMGESVHKELFRLDLKEKLVRKESGSASLGKVQRELGSRLWGERPCGWAIREEERPS